MGGASSDLDDHLAEIPARQKIVERRGRRFEPLDNVFLVVNATVGNCLTSAIHSVMSARNSS